MKKKQRKTETGEARGRKRDGENGGRERGEGWGDWKRCTEIREERLPKGAKLEQQVHRAS